MKTLPSFKVGLAFAGIFAGTFYQSCRLKNDARTLVVDDAAAQPGSSKLQTSVLPEKNPVVVQLFNWPFAKIEAEIPSLVEAGYTHIHVSPANLTVKTTQWWGRYQPVDYRVMGNVLGTEDDFRKMNETADKKGIKIIADVVLNHMADFETTKADFEATGGAELEYPPLPVQRQFGLAPLFRKDDFNRGVCINNFNDRFQVVFLWLCDARAKLPDLNLQRSNVLQVQRDYLRKLLSLGVDGFRFDAIKHMNTEYVPKLLEGVGVPENALVFGEIIASEFSFDEDLKPYLESSNLRFYDFPLLHRMAQAFGNEGDLGGALKNAPQEKAALAPERAVTFVMNHDLPTNGNAFAHLMLSPRDEILANGFVFARRDGIPYVYSDLGEDPATGLVLPRFNRFHAQSSIHDMIRFRGKTQGLSEQWFLQTKSTIGFARGDSAALVLNKASTSYSLKGLAVPLQDGTYVNVLGNRATAAPATIEVQNGKIASGEIAGHVALMLERR